MAGSSRPIEGLRLGVTGTGRGLPVSYLKQRSSVIHNSQRIRQRPAMAACPVCLQRCFMPACSAVHPLPAVVLSDCPCLLKPALALAQISLVAPGLGRISNTQCGRCLHHFVLCHVLLHGAGLSSYLLRVQLGWQLHSRTRLIPLPVPWVRELLTRRLLLRHCWPLRGPVACCVQCSSLQRSQVYAPLATNFCWQLIHGGQRGALSCLPAAAASRGFHRGTAPAHLQTVAAAFICWLRQSFVTVCLILNEIEALKLWP